MILDIIWLFAILIVFLRDRHICEVPMKGSVLTATSGWWFKKIEKNWVLRATLLGK